VPSNNSISRIICNFLWSLPIYYCLLLLHVVYTGQLVVWPGFCDTFHSNIVTNFKVAIRTLEICWHYNPFQKPFLKILVLEKISLKEPSKYSGAFRNLQKPSETFRNLQKPSLPSVPSVPSVTSVTSVPSLHPVPSVPLVLNLEDSPTENYPSIPTLLVTFFSYFDFLSLFCLCTNYQFVLHNASSVLFCSPTR
jgi:hypothetical protein